MVQACVVITHQFRGMFQIVAAYRLTSHGILCEKKMADSRLGSTTPLAPPLYLASVYNLPDIDVLDKVMGGQEPGFIYARDAHPNAAGLAEKISSLHKASWGYVTGSGMGALVAACLSCVSQGDRIVASDRLYGRTNKLLRDEMSRFGVKTTFVDCNDLEAVREAFQSPAKMLLVETISNPLLRVVDVPVLAGIAHARGAKLLVDNTFATPVTFRPLERGADFVMESLTKLISGHGDVTLGYLGLNDANLKASVGQIISTWGLSSNPFDCWLCERGLSTLEIRSKAASANAQALADWLAKQPGVVRIVYPGRSEHPDHAIAKRLLNDGFGAMLAFEVQGGRDGANRFMRGAPTIPFSPSLGHTETTLSHPDSTSHRYENPDEKARQTITPGLIRLSVGIENCQAIAAEIQKGLKCL
jgi:cystathionine beta-lyase/cystathionine gamma-synthase